MALVRLGALWHFRGVIWHTAVIDEGHGGAVVRVCVYVRVRIRLHVCMVHLRQEPPRHCPLRQGRLQGGHGCLGGVLWRLRPEGGRGYESIEGALWSGWELCPGGRKKLYDSAKRWLCRDDWLTDRRYIGTEPPRTVR